MGKQNEHGGEQLPARMKDGPWEEFVADQPNAGGGKPPAREEKEGDDRPAATSPRIDHDDPVEEASDESFPASDPPSWTP